MLLSKLDGQLLTCGWRCVLVMWISLPKTGRKLDAGTRVCWGLQMFTGFTGFYGYQVISESVKPNTSVWCFVSSPSRTAKTNTKEIRWTNAWIPFWIFIVLSGLVKFLWTWGPSRGRGPRTKQPLDWFHWSELIFKSEIMIVQVKTTNPIQQAIGSLQSFHSHLK